ncbi:hypothetical protein [Aquimarina celericrescens]|uniref:Uncharacterized protein n=1 Tax=Aquimarina celericrescens TaxID=1964542 RepID=A0ABW5AYP6_9FLAO
MLNNILKQSGVKQLDRAQRSKIGGGDDGPFGREGYCPVENGWYVRYCHELCDDGTTPMNCGGGF